MVMILMELGVRGQVFLKGLLMMEGPVAGLFKEG
jgi:hypothetical protein